MKSIWKYIISWVLAVIITLSAAVYQRTTGPTYERKIKYELNGELFAFKLPRSCDTSKNCEVMLPAGLGKYSANLIYKRYKTGDKWDTIPMQIEGEFLTGRLPKQPMAGKLQYYVELTDGEKTLLPDGDRQTVVRYKGDVPAYILVPHIILIFFAMLLSNVTGLIAAFRLNRMRIYSIITLIMIGVGGMIMGPIVQKFAFGELWTGFPFGWDLTDNKTLIAFIVWIAAVALNRKRPRPWWIIIAAIVTIVIFSIPHSMFGSELDYASGTVTQG